MGIMYKLMKHRHSTMDLSKEKPLAKTKSDKCRLITIEGNIIESNDMEATSHSEEDTTKDMVTSDMDKQFTAEHILQLCKFLAEKSKRNKNLYKQQQSPKKITKSTKQTEFNFQQLEYDDNEDVDYYQNEALPLLTTSPTKHEQHKDEEPEYQHNNLSVLSTRLSPDINSLNISSTTTGTSCAMQHHQQQQIQQQQQSPQQQQNQGKRDILLKIRNQIFERKRLREKGGYEPQLLNNSQVWRPW